REGELGVVHVAEWARGHTALEEVVRSWVRRDVDRRASVDARVVVEALVDERAEDRQPSFAAGPEVVRDARIVREEDLLRTEGVVARDRRALLAEGEAQGFLLRHVHVSVEQEGILLAELHR